MLKNQLGLTVFLDKGMAAGDAADDTILHAASGAHVGLALFSREFAEREWPLRELKIFVGRGSLLPALVPPLSYEAWKKFIQNATLRQASLSKEVRIAAQGTMMVRGSVEEMLTWKQRVCLAVVGALVDKARAGLPDRAWAGELKLRIKAAAERVAKFTTLTVGETETLRDEARYL